MSTKQTTRIQSWEKSGKKLLDEYLDTLAPEIVVWIEENEITEWPDIQENDNLVEELPSFNNKPPQTVLVNAFGEEAWDGYTLKLTALIMNHWPDPKDVPGGD